MELENVTPPTGNTTYANVTAAPVKKNEHWIDIRDHFNFYEAPDFTVFTAAVRKIFKADPKVIILKLTGIKAGVFKLISCGPPTLNYVTFKRKNKDTGVDEDVQVPLTTSGPGQPGQRSRDEDDLLITIVKADVGSASDIEGPEFDSVLAEYGELVVPTLAQKFKNTSFYNGNRYCVVNRKNTKHLKIPDRIDVGGMSFLLKYRGKEWMCSSCNKLHIGACPYLTAFYEQRAQKEKLKLTTAVVGDSALRYVENVGLNADVACMSGACVGQLATALEDNPLIEDFKNIIIAAGANDTKPKTSIDEYETLRRIDLSLNKVTALAERREQVNFVVLNTIPPDEDGDVTPSEFVTRMYFNKRLDKISTSHDNIEHLQVHNYPEKWQYGHPTVKCTKKILKVMSTLQKDLILNEQFSTTENMYRGVDNLWLSGCTGCQSRGRFASGGFCTTCLTKIDEDIDDKDLFIECRKFYYEEYPQSQKRSREMLTSSDDNCHEGKLQKL